jgi:NADPH2:quinone reductase
VKAIIYDHAGDPGVLELRDRDIREPGSGEVRVRVEVSGVNPTDWKSRATGPVTSPKVPNQDGAGVVDAVGADVTDFAPGDRVWLWDVAFQTDEGTAQQFVTLPADHVVALPDNESFDTGASLGIPALTAHLALTSNSEGPARLAPGALDGRFVLVTGGAGAVGHAAIQLAVWAGATVLTTVSGDEKGELARRAGAHHVINYRDDDVAAAVRQVAPDGVDTIVDVNIAANIETDVKVVAANGTIASYTDDGGGQVTLSARSLMGRNVRVQFLLTYTASAAAKANALGGVSAALEAGALRVGEQHGLPITRFALADTAGAHAAVEDGVVGKVLVYIDA